MNFLLTLLALAFCTFALPSPVQLPTNLNLFRTDKQAEAHYANLINQLELTAVRASAHDQVAIDKEIADKTAKRNKYTRKVLGVPNEQQSAKSYQIYDTRAKRYHIIFEHEADLNKKLSAYEQYWEANIERHKVSTPAEMNMAFSNKEMANHYLNLADMHRRLAFQLVDHGEIREVNGHLLQSKSNIAEMAKYVAKDPDLVKQTKNIRMTDGDVGFLDRYQ